MHPLKNYLCFSLRGRAAYIWSTGGTDERTGRRLAKLFGHFLLSAVYYNFYKIIFAKTGRDRLWPLMQRPLLAWSKTIYQSVNQSINESTNQYSYYFFNQVKRLNEIKISVSGATWQRGQQKVTATPTTKSKQQSHIRVRNTNDLQHANTQQVNLLQGIRLSALLQHLFTLILVCLGWLCCLRLVYEST